jgi:hypothetical protein
MIVFALTSFLKALFHKIIYCLRVFFIGNTNKHDFYYMLKHIETRCTSLHSICFLTIILLQHFL